jgi:hypothetical protein
MGLTACDQEPRERVREQRRTGLRAVRVEVAQRLADVAAVIDGARKLTRSSPRPSLNTDPRQGPSKALQVTYVRIAMLALRRSRRSGASDASARLT